MNVGQFPKSPLNLLFTAASSEALDLLAKCFIYEPRRRITAKDVSDPWQVCGRQYANSECDRACIILTSSLSPIPHIHPSFPRWPQPPRQNRSKWMTMKMICKRRLVRGRLGRGGRNGRLQTSQTTLIDGSRGPLDV